MIVICVLLSCQRSRSQTVHHGWASLSTHEYRGYFSYRQLFFASSVHSMDQNALIGHGFVDFDHPAGRDGVGRQSSSDWSRSQAAIWARRWKPNLTRMFSTWLSAVHCETTGLVAMSLLLMPSVISVAHAVRDQRGHFELTMGEAQCGPA
jgi:hypothetical protein